MSLHWATVLIADGEGRPRVSFELSKQQFQKLTRESTRN